MLAGLWRGLEGLGAAEGGRWEARVRQGVLQRRAECRQRGQAGALSPLAAPAVVGTAGWPLLRSGPGPNAAQGRLGREDANAGGRGRSAGRNCKEKRPAASGGTAVAAQRGGGGRQPAAVPGCCLCFAVPTSCRQGTCRAHQASGLNQGGKQTRTECPDRRASRYSLQTAAGAAALQARSGRAGARRASGIVLPCAGARGQRLAGRRTSSAASSSLRASTGGSAAPRPGQGRGTRAHSAGGRGWRAAAGLQR